MIDTTPAAGKDSQDSPHTRDRAAAGGLRRLATMFTQPVAAISDQGLFALGNFAITTILARQMSREAFGQFSSAFAAFLLLSTVYCAFVIDPMLVYGVSKADQRQRSYVKGVLALHWRVAILLSFALIVFGFIRSQTHSGAGSFFAYLGWAIAAPAVLRLWLARRTTYLIQKPQYAALGGGAYLLLIVILLFAFGSYLTNNSVAACLIIGGSSLGIGILLHRMIPLRDAVAAPGSPAQDRLFGDHWTFGRWASIAGVLGLLPDYIYFFVLSPEQCGEYRALLNVVIPLIQAYNALGVLLMSYFARHRKQEGFTRLVLKTSAAYGGSAVVLAALALGLGGRVFNLLYAGKYDLRFTLLLPLAMVSVLFALKTISDALLRSLESVTTMAALSAVGAIAAVACGVPLALRFGVAGAAWGDLLVYCIVIIAVAIVWIRRHRLARTRRLATQIKLASAPGHYADLAISEAPFQSFTES